MSFCVPDERLGILVAHADVLLDSGDELLDAAQHAVAQTVGEEVTEEALDHVGPGRRVRADVHLEPRMFGEPVLDLGMPVSGVAVAYDTRRLVRRRFPIDLTQELRSLDAPMVPLAVRDERIVQVVYRGNQRGGAVALVAVRQARGMARRHRQARLDLRGQAHELGRIDRSMTHALRIIVSRANLP